ncbi:hypothetical protein NVP1161O_025 [Vibrio phage 1.161.O._10N.261.48.C5]|nr:hypothetical protein NVP1161O_025 [Vibrio phage 1.161.O._10N.261.48.C5]
MPILNPDQVGGQGSGGGTSDTTENGQIPVKENGSFVASGMQKLADGQILAPKNFGVESASIDFGELVTMSEQSGFVGIKNNFTDNKYLLVDFESPRNAPANSPRIFRTIEPEVTFDVQPDDSTLITGTELTFDYTTTLNAFTNSLTFKTQGAMSNVRVKISPQGSDLGLKYLPDKASWLSESGGLDFNDGLHEVDIFDSSLALTRNTPITVHIKADAITLLGNSSNIPYLQIKKQDAEFNTISTRGAHQFAAAEESPVIARPNTEWYAVFAASASNESIVINLEDGVNSSDRIEFVFAFQLGNNSVVFNANSDIGFFNSNINRFDFFPQLILTNQSRRVVFEWYGSDWRIVP